MSKSNEHELINRLLDRSSQREAFEQVVRLYSKRLYNQVRNMVGSHEDTNDILQNIFVKAWCNLEYFRGESKLSTWLYRIAVNETLNFLQRRHETADIDSLPTGSEPFCNDLYFDGNETQRRLQEAIAELPDKQRMVFTLKYFQEMKYEEMSIVLQTSVGALKASYHHAVKKIYAILGLDD